MGPALLLDSTRVVPRRLEQDQFSFGYPQLAQALEAEWAVLNQ
jgi:NAD dependent epimerase/dehydratase family enzyme